MNPARILVFGLGAAVAAGTLLLKLPQAAAPGAAVTWLDAFFTAMSAVCVTGLTVLDTGRAWSPFGQVVILALMQIGGLGIMTVSALVALVLGRRITLRDRLVMRQALQESDLAGLVRLLRYVAAAVLAIEAVGALLLSARFLAAMPWPRALWFGVFHAVSSFNNAGFDLFGTSLRAFAEDGFVLTVVGALAVLGGLGFHVLVEFGRRWGRRTRAPLSLHTRVVLAATALTTAAGAAGILALEWNNPSTLGALPPAARVGNALFAAAAGRTSGFSTVDTAMLSVPTLVLLVALMFVGGAPGSTAGGVKVTTVAAVWATVAATARGSGDPVLFRRRLDRDLTDRALALFVIALVVMLAAVMALLLLEGGGFLPALFQVTSALGTVGLTMSGPAGLGAPGRLLLALAMFAGRVGPLTLVFALASRRRRQLYRYPEERLPIG